MHAEDLRALLRRGESNARLLAATKALVADIDDRIDDEQCWCLPDAPDSRGVTCEACQLRAAIASVESM